MRVNARKGYAVHPTQQSNEMGRSVVRDASLLVAGDLRPFESIVVIPEKCQRLVLKIQNLRSLFRICDLEDELLTGSAAQTEILIAFARERIGHHLKTVMRPRQPDRILIREAWSFLNRERHFRYSRHHCSSW